MTDWTLEGISNWVLSGGGAAVIAYWLMSNVPVLKGLSAEAKRYASYALAGGLAIAAWALLAWFGLGTWPVGPQAWLNEVIRVIMLGIVGSQVAHARQDLSKRTR